MRISKMERAAIALISSVFLSVPAHSQTRLEPMAKAYFFRTGGFGSFALIEGAVNENDARNNRDYLYAASGSACYTIPEQDVYYFAINSRDPGHGGVYWASFASIIYHNGRNRNFVNLYRNAGWVGQDGRPLRPANYETDSFRIAMTPQKFMEYHRLGDAQHRQRARADFQRIAGQFHGRWRPRSIDSWDYFPTVTGQISSQFRNMTAMGVSLYRYQVTPRDTPDRLVAVRIPRLGSTRFTLIIETPGLDGQETRHQRLFATSRENCR